MIDSEISNIQSKIVTKRSKIDQLIGEAKIVAREGKRLTEVVDKLSNDVDMYDKIVGILNTISEDHQNLVQRQIESLVTKGLVVVFGEGLSFHMTSSVRGKLPVVDFFIRSTSDTGVVIETPVMDARGGGMASVVGFLLRVVILLLSQPKHRLFLILDETFAMVSEEYEPRLAEFLKDLSVKTGIQLILVTHSDAYMDSADVRYRFALDSSGNTVCTKL